MTLSADDILWDFGVIIDQSNSKNTIIKKEKSHLDLYIDSNNKISPLITNSFIAPVKVSQSNSENNNNFHKIYKEPIHVVSEKNIGIVIDLVGKKYLHKDFQSIIQILENSDLSLVMDKERVDLEYCLIDALYQIGNYTKASLLIESSYMKQKNDDRVCLMLGLIYEAQKKYRLAKKQSFKVEQVA